MLVILGNNFKEKEAPGLQFMQINWKTEVCDVNYAVTLLCIHVL